jgi:preprotein translocase subunit SecY
MIKNKNIILEGVRPGKQTEQYIEWTIKKLTLLASLYLFVLIVIPDVFYTLGFSFYFGGTALLIVVINSLDWIKQIKSHFEVLKYKKINKQLQDIL